MSFESPGALLLLLALPIIWYIGLPRYRYRRRRDGAALVLRSIIVLCVVLAIAGIQWVQVVDKLAVIFVVDVSDSMGTEIQTAQLDYIREAVEDKPIDDEWALLVFGENPLPETTFNALRDVPDFQSNVRTGNTNIAEAIQTAISLFPADARRRIVILSDGQETLGSAEVKAQLAEASGIEISYVPFYREAVTDTRISALETPAQVFEGQQFDIDISIEADEATSANLLLYSGGSLIRNVDLDLQAGTTGYTVTQTAQESGFLKFTARISTDEQNDSIPQNNSMSAFSQVVGPPRVLLVASDAAEIVQFLPALEDAGVNVDVRLPENIPLETDALLDYRTIILANVPSADLTQLQMERIQSYVRDLGGGLVFIGGPESYGPGIYQDTPIEAALPVESRIRDQERIPQLTIAYLIDRSGSMGVTSEGGIANIELAKQAINLSIDLLEPTDRAAVATFDSGGAWLQDQSFQNVENKRQIQQIVGTLRPGGGTDILAGMNLVAREIVNEPSERKHIILMTDGGASPGGLISLTRDLYEDAGVTTSVIAIGRSQPNFLRQMTEVADGNYHVVRDISEIPNIFAIETVLATRSYIEEGEFTLVQSARSPIMTGVRGLPPLNGYVATTAKDTAQVVLRGPEPFSDPILATWQYGLGRAVAFTGDATARWATRWLSTSVYPRFWNQVVTWTITESSENIESRIVMEDNRARIIVDARDDASNFLNNLALRAAVVYPDESITPENVLLNQVAPGRYEGVFRPSGDGAYFVSIRGAAQGVDVTPIYNDVNGWVLSYSREYIEVAPDETLLA